MMMIINKTNQRERSHTNNCYGSRGPKLKEFAKDFYPGDFVTNVKQINIQSDLISLSSFAGPFHLTIRSSVYIF